MKVGGDLLPSNSSFYTRGTGSSEKARKWSPVTQPDVAPGPGISVCCCRQQVESALKDRDQAGYSAPGSLTSQESALESPFISELGVLSR